jgi:hypothetical protein
MFAHLHPPNAFWVKRFHFITEVVPIDLDQRTLWFSADRSWMSPPEEPQPGNDEPPPKPSRLEEARRVIAEYAADLREIIKKLRRRLN